MSPSFVGIVALAIAASAECAATEQLPSRTDVKFEVHGTGTPLRRELRVALRDEQTGAALSGVPVAFDVDMPSMPMVHRIPRATAEPTTNTGEYKAEVAFEMPGEWAAKILAGHPPQVITTRKFNVTESPSSSPRNHGMHHKH